MGCSYVNKIQRQIIFTTSCVYIVHFLSRTPALFSVYVTSSLVTRAFFWKSSSRMRIIPTVTLYTMLVSGCPTGLDFIATVFQSFHRTNQQFCLATCSQVVSVACLFSGSCTRNRWSMVSFFCTLYVYLKRAFFHCVTGDGSYKMGVCLWLIEASKSFLGLVRYWILCFLLHNIIVFNVTPIC